MVNCKLCLIALKIMSQCN